MNSPFEYILMGILGTFVLIFIISFSYIVIKDWIKDLIKEEIKKGGSK